MSYRNQGKSKKPGLGKILYWMLIGWVIWLIKWYFILLYRFIKWLVNKLPYWINSTSTFIHNRLATSGHNYSMKKVNQAVTAGFVVFVVALCGVAALISENDQSNQPVAATETVQSSPTLTLTAVKTSTPEPTSTDTQIPPTPTPLYGTNQNSECIPKGNQVEIAQVTRVIDGDTIVVTMNDQEYHLRYIGIDSPENGDPYEAQSTAKNVELVLGKTVYLVKDQSETDSFDRLLRYVFVGDIFVNYEMVLSGAALAGSWPPDTSCFRAFSDIQTTARDAKAGLWNIPPTAYPTIAPTAVVIAPTEVTDSRSGIIPIDEPDPTTAPSDGCDPAYPTVCIPSPPPDLDCPDITYRRFEVNAPDPHNFDSDGDGIGCESG